MSRHTRARKCEYDGHKFDSGAEMLWYRDNLKPRLLAGEITGLEVHPRAHLYGLNGHRVGDVARLDFRYVELPAKREVWDEVKGRVMPGFPIRRDLIADNYPSVTYRIVRRKRNGTWDITVVKPRSKKYACPFRKPEGV